MITDEQYDFLAQINHVEAGLLAVLIPATFGTSTSVYWVAGIFLVYCAVKEFWYDQNYETAEVRGSNLRDFLFYALGVAVGLGSYLLFHH